MAAFSQKLRWMVAIGLGWGVLWVVIGVILGTVIETVHPDSIDPGEEPIFIAWILGRVGFVSGFVFGCFLCIFERHKRLVDLPLVRECSMEFLPLLRCLCSPQ